SSLADLQILLGSGFDQLLLGFDASDVSGLTTRIDVDAGTTGNADALFIADQSAAVTGAAWVVQSTHITRNGFALLHYQHFDRLEMTLDTGANLVQISG